MSVLEIVPDPAPPGGTELRPGRRRRGVPRIRRSPTAVAGLVIVVVLTLAAVFAPVLAPRNPNTVDLAHRFAPPSRRFPLGTDDLGRDILSRLLFGARISIGATVVAAMGVSVIGLALGLLAGYLGGIVDSLISRTIDALLAFPAFLLALGVTGALGPGLAQVMIAVVAIGWVSYARIIRAVVVAERESVYVDAARALGASHSRILGRHLLPNVVGSVAVLTTQELGAILLGISAFSFLGLGAGPPTAEWGAMLSEASKYLGRAPYMMAAPGAAIFVMVLGFNLLGDGLRDLLDPRMSPSPLR